MQAPESAGELPDDLIDAKTAALLLKVNINTLYRWGQRGKVAAWRRGRAWFFSRAGLLAAFQRVEPQAPAPVATSRQERDFIAASLIQFGLQEPLPEEERPAGKPEHPPPEHPPNEPPAWLVEELRRRGIRP